MALILDKTITGATSTDKSGNILTTGYTNLSYVYSGITYENPYLVITSVFVAKYLNNNTNQIMNTSIYNGISAVINISIYSDKDARINGNRPISVNVHNVNTRTIYDAYFLIQNTEDANGFKKSYEYISTLYPNWKSDE